MTDNHLPTVKNQGRGDEARKPVVSVIVPNFNHVRYIRQRIESILAQTFSDFELILLDDCSTDDSPNILLEYRGHPAVSHVIQNERNSGSPFLQWDKGIRLARGRYVWIAESDDTADPGFLEATVEQLEKHPEARLCITGSHVIDCEGNPRPMDFDRWEEDGSVRTYEPYDYLLTHMLKLNSVYNASMVLFRREGCLDNICTEYRRMRYCGDWLFWNEQIRKGSVIEIRRKLNRFRKHPFNTVDSGIEDGHLLVETVFIHRLLCKKYLRDWRISLNDKYEQYLFARNFPVSSPERHRELMREIAREGRVTWWHYRLWKLYLSYRKHILRKPKLTFLDRIKG